MIGTSQVGAPHGHSPSGILMPIFSVRKVNTSVTIFDGATVIIGGLTREEVKTVNDKIPVLGIFLCWVAFSIFRRKLPKRNLLIFVSASIVSREARLYRSHSKHQPSIYFQRPRHHDPDRNHSQGLQGAGQPAANN